MAGMKDVAKAANVSIATVSHVINGTRFVSKETTDRIKKVMKELDYQHNMAAFSLRTRKAKAIGLLIPILLDETSNIFFMQLALGVESELKKHGYISFLGNTDENLEGEMATIKSFKGRQIDGLIIAPCLYDHKEVSEVIGDCPVVYVDREPEGIVDQDCVLSNSEEACYEAISQQIEMGHRRIGVICGTLTTTGNIRERLNGYKRALEDRGIPFDDTLVIEGESRVGEGYQLAQRLFEPNKNMTSLLLTNNCHALGALKYIKEKGLHIPEDINITVFDDYDWTSVYNPSLTVIRQDAYDIGEKAVQVLLKRMLGKKMENKIYRLPNKIIIRDSWCPVTK